MNYKEQTFEIDNNLISFKSNKIIPIIGILTSAIVFGLIMYSRDLTRFLFWFIGCSLGIFSLFYFFGFSKYLIDKISLTEITHIEVKAFKTDIEKSKFKGTGQVRNYFPSGLDKQKADKLIFIYQKNKKVIIGLAPDNCAETISAFRANGINVIG